MEDFEARSQPYLPEGQRPRGTEKQEWSGNSPLSALGRESVVDISEGTLQREARSVLPGLPSCQEWMPYVPLTWDRSCLTACG